MTLFQPLQLTNITLKNRIIRSATYEGGGNLEGIPNQWLSELYGKLAAGGTGTIITGFVFISQEGRAMQPRQCGIDSDDKIGPWQNIVSAVHDIHPSVKLIMQIAHTGRQTLSKVTGLPVVGATSKKCTYFRQKVTTLDEEQIQRIITEFGLAAFRAKQAGFDGVQVHAAHGYLIHQFLSPWTNTRTDRWADKPLFLEEAVRAIKTKCGANFPVLVKLSAADDNNTGVRLKDTIQTVKRLDPLGVEAYEISYGTMEYALNIIRGNCPIEEAFEVNPIFNQIPGLLQKIWKAFFLKSYLRRFIAFAENYNLEATLEIKRNSKTPVITVGGLRSAKSMAECINKHGLAAVSLCRPLICEPDFPLKIQRGINMHSKCTQCNLCAIYCDSKNSLRCYRRTPYDDTRKTKSV